jgi:hypothetical protein
MTARSIHEAIGHAACLAALLGLAACGNPVVDNAIEEWGGEVPGVDPSEHHRPGQPCVLCHSVAGGASPRMALGGTVFADQRSFLPVEGVRVIVYDAVGDVYEMESNCIGNFYLEYEDPVPQFPLAVEIKCPLYAADGSPREGEVKVVSMNSWISRDGSCASCHSLRGTQADSTGWIFCNDPGAIETNPYPAVPASCPGVAPAAAGSAPEEGGAQP